MNRILLGSLFIIALFVAPLRTAVARPVIEGESQTSRYVISVLIMGPGEELFSRFGHIALVVEDRERQSKKVYNFGTFDFSDPDLQFKYARGFLDYWLSIGSYPRTVLTYKHYDRQLVERTLNLSPSVAEGVARKLEHNALPENRTYAYRHYLDNCCTRIRDILNDAADGAVMKGRDESPSGRTFRDYTREALIGMPVMSTLILFSLGPAVDTPITRYDEQFLPSVLAEDLDEVTFGDDGIPLVTQKKVLVKRQGGAVGTSIPTVDVLIAIAFFGLLTLGLLVPAASGRRRGQSRLLGVGLIVWGLTAGLGGVALLLYWGATTHYDTHYNENSLAFLVTHLWLLGPGVKLIFVGRIQPKTVRILTLYFLISIGLIAVDLLLKIGPFIQGNYGFVFFAAACNAAAVIAVRRTAYESS